MPKRSSGNHDARPPKPPVSPPSSESKPEYKRLILKLINLNITIIHELKAGHQVILSTSGEDICAKSSLGSHIGDIDKQDQNRLRGLHVLAATVYELGLDPPLVIIEVIAE